MRDLIGFKTGNALRTNLQTDETDSCCKICIQTDFKRKQKDQDWVLIFSVRLTVSYYFIFILLKQLCQTLRQDPSGNDKRNI